jgi:peroxiredoxin
MPARDKMLKSESKTLRVGDAAPNFELPTADRTTVRLSDYRGKLMVLVFIRGTW